MWNWFLAGISVKRLAGPEADSRRGGSPTESLLMGRTGEFTQLRAGWTGLLMLWCVAAAWFEFSDFHLAPIQTWLPLIISLGIVLMCWMAFRFVRDRSNTRPIFVVSDRFELLCHGIVYNILLYAAIVLTTYLIAHLNWPLQDKLLSQADVALGFDWTSFLSFTNQHSMLAHILVTAYGTTQAQIVALFIFLALAGYKDGLAESISLLTYGSILTLLLNLAIPAAGAYAYYLPDQSTFTNFDHQAGMWHYQIFKYLRATAQPVIDPGQIEGIITFPSFHTLLAILTVYILRRTPLFAPALVLNSAVVVSTLPEGGHHLVDLLAGGGIAISAILFARVQRVRPANSGTSEISTRVPNWNELL